MLTVLDNCPIFVLQPFRGLALSQCGDIYNFWHAEELSINCSSSTLLISLYAAKTLFLQHIFFYLLTCTV